MKTQNDVRNVGLGVRNVGLGVRNVDPIVRNVDPIVRNVDPIVRNVDLSEPPDDQPRRCSKCCKILSSRNQRIAHEEKCNGLHTLQCKICLKMFTSYSGKSRHKKRVKCTPPSLFYSSGASANIVNMRDQYNNDNSTTNNDNSTTNNITNNNFTVNNNIVLNVHGKENYDTLLDTIRTKYPQAFVTMVEEGDTASLLKLVHFNKDFPENQTIRKPAKKDVSAEVHMGEGRWERRPTQYVIETFRGQTSRHLCESLEANIQPHEKHNDIYLKEILYEQSKIPSGNTESLLQPFMLNEQEIAKKELIKNVHDIKIEMLSEYPSIKGTKIFINQWKREARPLLHAFEDKWNTFDVSESIQWE